MIKFFKREQNYFEFSNYYSRPFEVDGVKFLNNEHYYQSQKFNRKETQEYYLFILQADSPQKAKDMANQRPNYRGESWYINKNKKSLGKMNDVIRKYKHLKIRPDWDDVKVDTMMIGLFEKFNQHDDLKQLLMDTGDREIQEASPYDSFWGTAKNGKNMLGKLLMELRDYFINE